MKSNFFKITFLFLLYINVTAYGQDTVPGMQNTIDSLKLLIEANPEDNIDKVILLNEYARSCFYNHEYLNGFEAARNARLISEKLNFDGGNVMYYVTLSAFHGNGYDEMYIYYQKQAQWLSNSLGSQLRNYYVEIDAPIRSMGNNNQALIDEFSKILNHFKEHGDKEIQANLLMFISAFNNRLNNYDEVLNIQDQIIQFFTELDQIYPVFLFSTFKMNALKNLNREDEANKIEQELVKLFVNIEDKNAIGLIANTLASGYANLGRELLAIEYYMKSIEVFERIGDDEMLAKAYFEMAVRYENLGLNSKASESYKKAIELMEMLNDSSNIYMAYGSLVFPTIAIEKYDEARQYMEIALLDTLNSSKAFLMGRFHDANGQIAKNQGKYEEAIPYFKMAMKEFEQSNVRWTAPFMPLYLTECYYQIGDYNTALYYGLRSLQLEDSLNLNNTSAQKRASLWLSKIYQELNNIPLAYNFLKIHQKIIEESEKLDELNRVADMEVQSILDKSRKEIDDLENERIQSEQKSRIQRLWIFSISGALLSAIVLALILFRNNKNKQRANKLLQEQKEEIQTTLEQLEATQTQLIQSEKMASLGELTAGIAHEIQNPLNFVNNFSEVNKELIAEMREEIANKNFDEVDLISKDIEENEEKINNHGKRAESIVKNMLLHSRGNAGQKEPTDLNALADEYLRLSYHGYRAKDKSFNADFKLMADVSIPKISVVPQDFGRVLLNLVNNAFYAAWEKSKQTADSDFKPMVTITTTTENNNVKIVISDNGDGIPDEVKEKIFQPFFTTKPTGLGTGLGLSLSYDIIKKGHNGDIKVNSTKGSGTEFIILIPIEL